MLNILTIHLQSNLPESLDALMDPRYIKDPALASYPVSSVKNVIERVENVKALWFLQSPVPNPQASPKA